MTVTTPNVAMTDTTAQAVTSVTKAAPDAFTRLLAAIESQNVGQKILLSLKECRTLTGLSDDNLRDAIHNGKLKAKIIGRGYKVKRDDLDSYIKKL
jgi:excisionase family DNA binding protein